MSRNLIPVRYVPTNATDARLYAAVTNLADSMVSDGRLIPDYPGSVLSCSQVDTLGIALHVAGFHAHGARMVASHLDRSMWADGSPCTDGGVNRHRAAAADGVKAERSAARRVAGLARGVTLALAVEAFALNVDVDGFDNGDQMTCAEVGIISGILTAGGYIGQAADVVHSHRRDEATDAHHVPTGADAERFARAYVLRG